MRYLDPKNDLIFKRVFGEHPQILKSFLNAVLPLDDRKIIGIEYLPTEMIATLPHIMKNSIVDVRCIDESGRQFIVEMQMLWTDSFKSRVLFNASKAYIKQLDKSVDYKGLQPVFALSIVNEIFEKEFSQWFHHYKMVHSEDTNKKLEGLELIFIELPKVKANNYNDKKLSILWMRYLYELENMTSMISEDLLEVPEIKEAIELTKESNYTKEELETYDKYWDNIRTEKTFIADAEAKGEEIGLAKGEEIGLAKGEEIGLAKGEVLANTKVILNLFDKGNDIDFICQIVPMDRPKVLEILTQNNRN